MPTYRKVSGNRVARVAKSPVVSLKPLRGNQAGMGQHSRLIGGLLATRFDNRINTHRPDEHPPTIRKVPAATVPYGDSISRNGQTVWVALDGDQLICVAATAEEARRKSRAIRKSLIANG
jgi:hypothetical protein